MGKMGKQKQQMPIKKQKRTKESLFYIDIVKGFCFVPSTPVILTLSFKCTLGRIPNCHPQAAELEKPPLYILSTLHCPNVVSDKSQ